MAVVKAIKQWIDTGELTPGAPIPPERALSARLHVQRPTIRRALRILETEGVIQTLGPRTRVVSERGRTMEHSIVVAAVGTSRRQTSSSDNKSRFGGWSSSMVNAVIEEVGRGRYHLVMVNPDRATERDVQQLATGRPSGVIVPEISGDVREQLRMCQLLRRAGIPMAVYGGNPELESLDRVTSDHFQGSYELTRHLISLGHKRILMLFSALPDTYWVKGRRIGYEKAMVEAGIEPLPMVTYAAPVPSRAEPSFERHDSTRRAVVGQLVDYVGHLAGANAVDAIMCASDGETFGVAGACRILGAEPGKNIEIAGYDNYWQDTWEGAFEPYKPVASVDKRNGAIGTELVSLLLDRIEGRLPEEAQIRIVTPELIISER